MQIVGSMSQSLLCVCHEGLPACGAHEATITRKRAVSEVRGTAALAARDWWETLYGVS